MKLLTLTDRLWGLGMTTTVYGVVVPALLMLGAGIGKAPPHPGALKTFDVVLPQAHSERRPVPRERRDPPARTAVRQALPPRPSEAVTVARFALPAAVPAPAPAALPAPPPAAVVVPQQLPPPAPAKAGSATGLDAYAARLWLHVAARRPAGIRLEGTTTVAFSLSRSGLLRDVSLVARSGNPLLDRLALRTVRSAAPFPSPPEALTDTQLRFTVPFSFR